MTNYRSCLLTGMLALVCLAFQRPDDRVSAQEEQVVTLTKVTVPDMHCEGCAKRIRKALYTLAGVSRVTTTLKDNLIQIEPVRGKSVEPYDIWDKLEQLKFNPTKLVGPDGEFDKKPEKAAAL